MDSAEDAPEGEPEVSLRAPLIPPPALLRPPAARGRASVVQLPGHWFALGRSGELGRRPLQKTLFGTPLVLFRDGDGRPAALLDRCPHRNVPLSLGEVVSGQLQCRYHGWRFDNSGSCRHIPSLIGDPAAKARCTPAYPAVDQQGFVWVYSTPGPPPTTLPYRFPMLDQPGYTSVHQVVYAESTMHAALENALDVPHTQFLHSGLFRSAPRGIEITAEVTRTADRVCAEYLGEPRPSGLVGRLLSPSGGLVRHFDRFILPSIAEVEYALGSENHFFVSAAMTPVSDFYTQINSVVSFRLRLLPGWLVKPILKPIALRIFAQDAALLKQQTANIQRFGGEQYAFTDIDVLGKHIWRLLRHAQRQSPASSSDAPYHERIRLLV
jgi:phenylpropionate dioxygenase-like ring-hydroxylating dioxygenase large terminal subunit